VHEVAIGRGLDRDVDDRELVGQAVWVEQPLIAHQVELRRVAALLAQPQRRHRLTVAVDGDDEDRRAAGGVDREADVGHVGERRPGSRRSTRPGRPAHVTSRASILPES
jgi:hypothetical protein